MFPNGLKSEQSQQQQADPMSGQAQEPPKEVNKEFKPAIPAFSYAQAAKSKAPSVPATPSASMIKSDTNENATKKETEPRPNIPLAESKSSAPKRATSEGAKPRRNDFQAGNESASGKHVIADGAVKELGSGMQAKSAASASQNISTSPSPDFGTTSILTLPKDDDGFSAVNDSSESTWDKQSQTSQNGAKNDEKSNIENHTAQKEAENPWDEPKPEPVSLKEAPLPTVNFWAQRMAQNPKPKIQQSVPLQSSKAPLVTNGAAGGNDSLKSTEPSGEPKKQENKKRSKGNLDDRSTIKEGSKPAEGKAKNGEGSNKANANAMAPPPPPGDAISWPTPETALEEKKKSQSRTEKDDKEKTSTTKPHGKKEWQTVPFVPTVNFNTPIPTSRSRGGRGSGGTARENGGRGRNTNGVDKATSTTANPTSQFSAGNDERGKLAASSSTAGPPTTQKSKRASSAGPTTVKEQRRPGDSAGGERRKDSELNSGKISQGKGAGNNESRRQSATAMNENQGSRGFSGRGLPREAIYAPRKSQTLDDVRSPQDTTSAAQVASRASEYEKRDGSVKPQDSTKETQSGTNPRERGDGRPERGGRGGYRGRGGSNFNLYNAHSQNGQSFSGPPVQYQQSMTGLPSRSFSNHERLGSQQQGSYYPTNQPPNRAYRSNSRSHSIQHTYGRFSHQPHGGPPHLANLQTDLANNYGYAYDPQPGSMSALPFNPYATTPNLFGMVAVQMDYYFSVDNLCKDMYLRKNMNSQGWIPLELVAGFNRIKQLTPDIGMVRDVCFHSNVIEARFAEDESVWLRKRGDWQRWVMDMDTRVPEARNEGPQFAAVQPFNAYGMVPPYHDGHEMSPRPGTASVPMDTIQYQTLEAAAAPLHQVVMAPSQQHDGANPGNPVPLSAAVSDFSPSVRSANGRVFSSPDPHVHGTSNISNEEMDKLKITFKAQPADVPGAELPPFHSASTRTLSNGSIDGNAIGSELPKFADRQSRPLVNGENPDSGDRSIVNRSTSPFSVGSPGRHAITSSPPVLWSKNKEHLSRVNTLSTEYTHASYPAFRQSALSQRERVTDICVYDMQVLYSFWAHFLIRNFNLHAYEEFHRLAVEDEAIRKSNFGMKSLIQYYDEALLGQRTIPNDTIVTNFIQIIKGENPKGDGPIFRKLRAAWRNGAWNAKNRSKISKAIDADLTAELDR